MSLKVVHLVFIACSVGLSMLVGVWGWTQYRLTGATSGLMIAAVFVVLGVLLALYAPRFWAKVKEMDG